MNIWPFKKKPLPVKPALALEDVELYAEWLQGMAQGSTNMEWDSYRLCRRLWPAITTTILELRNDD